MQGAQNFVSEPAGLHGLQGGGREDRHPSDRPRQPRRRPVLAPRHHLRALRRAAGRPAGALEDAALRADDQSGGRIYGRGAADNKGPLMTNIAAVGAAPGGEPQAAPAHHVPRRGRGGDGQPQLPRLPQDPRRPAARGRLRLPFRHGPPQQGPGGHHLRPARPGAPRPRGHGRQGRPALGPPRRGAAQPDPGAGRDHLDPPHARGQGQRARLLRRRARRRAVGAGRAGEARRRREGLHGLPRDRRLLHDAGILALRGDPLPADARIQRHRRRLPGRGDEDRHPEQGLREDQLPAGAAAGARPDQEACPRRDPGAGAVRA